MTFIRPATVAILVVTVRESDGTEQTFSVPYASVAQLLRPGSSRYSVTAGQLRSENLRDEPTLFQSTYQYGLTNAITGYGGLQISQDYYAVQVGAALGIPIGHWPLTLRRQARNWGIAPMPMGGASQAAP